MSNEEFLNNEINKEDEIIYDLTIYDLTIYLMKARRQDNTYFGRNISGSSKMYQVFLYFT
jgi:hypothetical protein